MSKSLFTAASILGVVLAAGSASAHPGHVAQTVAGHSHIAEYITFGLVIAGLSVAAIALLPHFKSILRAVKDRS